MMRNNFIELNLKKKKKEKKLLKIIFFTFKIIFIYHKIVHFKSYRL